MSDIIFFFFPIRFYYAFLYCNKFQTRLLVLQFVFMEI